MSVDPKEKADPSVFNRKDPHPERRIDADPDQDKLKTELDKALKDTFPASDTPSASQPSTLGGDKEDYKKH